MGIREARRDKNDFSAGGTAAGVICFKRKGRAGSARMVGGRFELTQAKPLTRSVPVFFEYAV